ncbi:hypothetical protein [Moritella sp. Urea-trap-13]|uniref:hypothetical protein n=1 Tax=Moritella sp. Urea-trap-13 TaxID=2058327 RepID=UPI000C333EB6|nr:hypothetical protein [Moritella sp. Urea-trap-13]PKH09418.1 hypothetical protein CXF93_00815 [Moritella sp. Urea-trap-13]
MLKVRVNIAEKQAKKLIFDLTKYSDHSNRELTDGLKNKIIEQWFEENKYPFKRLVSDTRNWNYTVPFVENTLDSKVYISGEGILNVNDYQGEFDSALAYRDVAINNADIAACYAAYSECITKLFASLTSYLSVKAEAYNIDNADVIDNEGIIDNEDKSVSLEDRISQWVPIFSSGKALDMNNKSWTLFLAQLAECNAHASNPTLTTDGLSATQLAGKVNDLRGGIISIMYELHVLLNDEIKSQLIRAVYFPDVYVSELA